MVIKTREILGQFLGMDLSGFIIHDQPAVPQKTVQVYL